MYYSSPEWVLSLDNVTGQFTGNYVYIVFVDGHRRYVGRGSGLRYMHPLSGKSSCALLNRDFFQGKRIQVVGVNFDLTGEEAIELEGDFIKYMAHFSQVDGEEFYNIQVK